MADHHASAPPRQPIHTESNTRSPGESPQAKHHGWGKYFKNEPRVAGSSSSSINSEKDMPPAEKWSLGILNDKKTDEVPGTVLLLSLNRNEPLGLRHQPERTSTSSLPSPYPNTCRPSSIHSQLIEKKKTPDGRIILDPQPDDSPNDPLNWSALRRDCALLSLGFYCMLGGGMTTILAAGFNDVASTFNVSYARVALTTGLYMMGLGVGSTLFSPTAILFGKRPTYLASAVIFILTSIWAAKSSNFVNLVAARVFQGVSVSPVECLPSATIAEIFFLHERAFRVGIYTLLLLGGKNVIPLVSAAIIEGLEWRWVFWIVAMLAGFGLSLLFLFVPETFWDRTPRPKSRRPPSGHRTLSAVLHNTLHHQNSDTVPEPQASQTLERTTTPRQQRFQGHPAHVGFVDIAIDESHEVKPHGTRLELPRAPTQHVLQTISLDGESPNLNSPCYISLEEGKDYPDQHPITEYVTAASRLSAEHQKPEGKPELTSSRADKSEPNIAASQEEANRSKVMRYTTNLRHAPPKTYLQTLRPWNGRLARDNWFLVFLRPFILFTYPSVLWSALIYALSVGWLIVLSESVTNIFRNKSSYNFSALGTGLIYLSPFVGGILGTAVAGKVSDIVIRLMARRNGGVYEPEFRLVMALPVALANAIGLMGFGWSAQERDLWIVPTIFFGVISFGCTLGSTTAITFCVDSYRQYAGEALVTLNFSKNIFHGLVFSLFFPKWLETSGPKDVFVAIGGIELACLLMTIPMYIFGKRARMWTVRKNWMEKL